MPLLLRKLLLFLAALWKLLPSVEEGDASLLSARESASAVLGPGLWPSA